MSYSARRGFTNGSKRPTGTQRQADMQQKSAQMQEQMTAAQETVERWLEPHGGLAALRADGALPCRYPPADDPPPPLCRPDW